MFYALELTKELDIPPRFLGPKLVTFIHDRLRQEIEGHCSGQHGFVIAVTGIFEIAQGIIQEGMGNAVFKVKYQCITFMPHKGEVLDAQVKSVNKV